MQAICQIKIQQGVLSEAICDGSTQCRQQCTWVDLNMRVGMVWNMFFSCDVLCDPCAVGTDPCECLDFALQAAIAQEKCAMCQSLSI